MPLPKSYGIALGWPLAAGQEFITLNALTVTPTTAELGEAYVGTVVGKTPGSVLSLGGTGANGLVVNGSVISGTPTTAGTVDIIETLAGAVGSPRTSIAALSTGVGVNALTLNDQTITLNAAPITLTPVS